MRNKDKVNINGQLPPEVFAKLKQISEDKKLSLIKTIELLIEGYQADIISGDPKAFIVIENLSELQKEKFIKEWKETERIPHKIIISNTKKIDEVRSSKEPTKAELWKAMNSKK